MPPKGSAITRAVVPKAQRRPAIQSYVTSTSGPRHEVRVSKVKPSLKAVPAKTAHHDDDYLTFQQTLVDEYQFDTPVETEINSQAVEEEEYIELERLPEEPEVPISSGKHSSGKVDQALTGHCC